jgi:PAS domain S-box-containing protein
MSGAAMAICETASKRPILRNVALMAALLLLFLFGRQAAPAAGSPHERAVLAHDQAMLLAQAEAQLRQDPPPRRVRVGLYENKPKIYAGEDGAAAGIFPAILEEIARKEQWRLAYVPCEWSACLAALQEGRIDLMPDVAYSPERGEHFDFHEEEVLSSWSAVYAPSRKQLSRIADLNGRRLAVLKDSIQQRTLEQMMNGFGFEVTFLAAASFEEAFSLTAGGAADAVVTNNFFGDYFHQQYGLEKTPIALLPVSLYFATAAGAHADLRKAVDDNLRAMKSAPGSVYYQALVRWMERPPLAIVPPYVSWIFAGIGGLLALALAFIFLLRWQVRAGTRHLADTVAMLRDSEQKFHDLFHQHAAVKLLVDPETGDIVEANASAEKFYGWPGEQLRRLRIQDINILPSEQVRKEMEQGSNRESIHFEFRHRLADGSVRDVAVFSSRIDMQGRPLLHFIIHDITERRRLEDQLRQAQKMESVGRLAGGVAHDYNNMLSVILGHTQMAMRDMAASGPLHAHLVEILNAARRSADITRQLLTFARRQTVAPRTLDLNETVAGMLKMLRRLIGEDIELEWLPRSGLAPVRVDPAQVDQILVNLCVNARHAIAGVGRITIATDNVAFDEAYCAEHADFVPGAFVLLAVSDNGRGMDRHTRDHAFEPFFTTKGVGEGTGLGLATVYGIVTQNSGFIHVYSEPEMGTTFRLYFPRHEGQADASLPEEPAEIPQGSGETVLLVEDDQAIREMCKKMLEDLGYRALAAGTPSEAVRLLSEHTGGIDLLITDMVMPEMNGLDLACRLRAESPELQAMFMSGYPANIIARQGAFDEGVVFLQKPFTQKDFAIKVRAGLAGKGAAAGGGAGACPAGTPAWRPEEQSAQ